ncbi:MAG: hypothetical protein IT376_23415 [Polyangiaceae bacterium]|nr:hypothetical protein [Polyangiaceae bacterium]
MAVKPRKRAPKPRQERRFLPDPTHTSRGIALLGFAGAALLGAGVYGQWIQKEPWPHAVWLVAAGAATVAASMLLGDRGLKPLRVGDAGVALEDGSELARLAWCDVERVEVTEGKLVLRGKPRSVELPISAYPRAVARLLAEGERRLPRVFTVDRAKLGLPEPVETNGELLPVDGLQVAGQHCAASGKVIAFERDARVCPLCAEVYAERHVPEKCVTCGERLGARAVEI